MEFLRLGTEEPQSALAVIEAFLIVSQEINDCGQSPIPCERFFGAAVSIGKIGYLVIARRNSRFILAMFFTEISFGQTASHS